MQVKSLSNVRMVKKVDLNVHWCQMGWFEYFMSSPLIFTSSVEFTQYDVESKSKKIKYS